MKIALNTLEYLDAEVDFVPWKSALRELEHMRSLLQLTPVYGLFEVQFMSSNTAHSKYNKIPQ